MRFSRNCGKQLACLSAALCVLYGAAEPALAAGAAPAPGASAPASAAAPASTARAASEREQAPKAALPDYGVALGAPYDDASFWCDAAGEELLGTAEDVARLNEELRARQPSLAALSELPRAASRAQLRHWIEAAAPERETWYAPTEPLSEAAYRAVLENCALSELPLRSPLRYGVTVHRADLRHLPTSEAWLDTPDDVHYDSLQATAVDPAEPLAVWSESRDGRFLFVSTRYYRGWLAKETVAFTTREKWLAYAQPQDFLVVTQSRYEAPAAAGRQLYQLGSRIPLVQQGGTQLARLPQRAPDGSLEELLLPLPYREDGSAGAGGEGTALHRGNLPYTANNLRRSAFACLGDVYGWGGQDESVDCSAFVADVYRTVGIELPRDADEQEVAFGMGQELFAGAGSTSAVGRQGAFLLRHDEEAEPQPISTALDELSPAERTQALLAAPPASLLFRPDHVMLVLGSDAGKTYIIHSLSGCWEKTEEGLMRRRIRRVLVSDAYFLTSTGGRNLDACTSIGSFAATAR